MGYQDYEGQLEDYANRLDTQGDKPMRRMYLNDFTDMLHREINSDYSLSNEEQEDYCERITNYCISRHRK